MVSVSGHGEQIERVPPVAVGSLIGAMSIGGEREEEKAEEEGGKINGPRQYDIWRRDWEVNNSNGGAARTSIIIAVDRGRIICLRALGNL